MGTTHPQNSMEIYAFKRFSGNSFFGSCGDISYSEGDNDAKVKINHAEH